MGAIPYSDASGTGVTFRVWAPFAAQVAVAGDFNGWSQNATLLFPDPNNCGNWSTDVPGATTGQTYKFVISNPAGNPFWRMDPYARSIAHDAQGNLNGLIATSTEGYDATTGFSTPNWNQMVIYEIHTGTFSQTGGIDGNGGFTGIINQLPYLAGIGINAIEILPLGEFVPQPSETSGGYNPAYIFAVEDEYGGPDGFRQLVNAAHAASIAVIVDVVYNHLGNSAGDMWNFDGWSISPYGGIYFYNDGRCQTAGFGATRFDYGRSQIFDYLGDNVRRWLQLRFADGLRFDSTINIRNVKGYNNDPADDLPDGWRLMQTLNGIVQQSQPWKITVAEDLQENNWLTLPQGPGGAGFGAQWGASFGYTLRSALIAANDSDRDMNAVAGLLGQTYNCSAFQRVVYTETHDLDDTKPGDGRVPQLIWPGAADSWAAKKRSTLGAAAVMTAPGIPMIFQGQEFLSWAPFDPGVPLDWSNQAKFGGIVQLYSDLIKLRRNWYNYTRGLNGQNTNVFHVNNTNKVVAFHRWDQGGPGDDVIIVLNFGNQGYPYYSIGFPQGGHWQVRFNSDSNSYDPSFGDWFSYGTDASGGPQDNMPCSGNVGLGPYTALILTQ